MTPPNTPSQPIDQTPAPRPHASAGTVTLHALFLAASWTWVIGMFLPVLLTERHGAIAWFPFALFNVVGAASVGIVLKNPDRARRFAANHAMALGAFALATAAFQLYAASWLIRETFSGPVANLLPLGLDTGPSVTAATTAFVALAIAFAVIPFRWSLAAAAGVIAVSVTAMVLAALGIFTSPFSTPAITLPDADTDPASLTAIALLTPAIAAGFLLCPYLDPTLNRVRQALPNPTGPAAFALGFAGPFLLMILFTLAYAKHFHEHNALPAIVAIHLIVQAAFTAGVHVRALGPTRILQGKPDHRGIRKLAAWKLFLATVALLAMLPLGNALPDLPDFRPGRPAPELVYDGFIGLYALLFPAYVWLCAVPITPLASRSRRARLIVLTIALAITTPAFAIGSLNDQHALITAAIALLAITPWLAAVFVRSTAGTSPSGPYSARKADREA